jgi:hypothetical protein
MPGGDQKNWPECEAKIVTYVRRPHDTRVDILDGLVELALIGGDLSQIHENPDSRVDIQVDD